MLVRRSLPLVLAVGLAAAPCLADCTSFPGDTWPGLLDVSVAPPRWVVTGDGRITAADLVVLLQARNGARTLAYAPPLGFQCPATPGDLSPGRLDESTDPPTWRAGGDSVIDDDDIAVAESETLGLRQEPSPGLTGMWTGPLTLQSGDEQQHTSAVVQLIQSGSEITGCIVTGGEAEGASITGMVAGAGLTLFIQDTCNPDPVTVGLDASGESLVMTSLQGSLCSSDPDGGNVQLYPLSGGTMELSRLDVTGTWMGSPLGTVDGIEQPLRTVLELTSDCPVFTGRLSLFAWPALPATGTLDGNILTMTATPVQSPASDCHLYPLRAAFDISGGALEARSIEGMLCEPDDAGGHLFLTSIAGGAGPLTRGSLTGAWSGMADVTVDGSTETLPMRLNLFQSGERVSGSYSDDAGAWKVVTGWMNGRRSRVAVRTQPSPPNDCSQFRVLIDLLFEQGTLSFLGADGMGCVGDGMGGHSGTFAVTAATGVLTRH